MRKLSRKKDNRELMVRNLLTSIILYESVKTTKAKSKVLKPEIDKLITRAKKNNLEARRYISGYLLDKKAYEKMFEVIVPMYKNRKSGFSRAISLTNRVGDNAEIVIVELIDKINSQKKEIESKEDNGK